MRTFLKRTCTLLLASFLITAFIGISPAVASSDDPYFSKVFNLDGAGNLNIKTSGGSIKVESHSGNTVRLEMYLRKGNKNYAAGDREAEELLEEYSIDIKQSGNTISAIAEKTDSEWFNFAFGSSPSISFKVLVPRSMSTDLKTSGGSISLEGVKGNQQVKTSGGSLKLSNIEGSMDARTSGGSIQIANYQGMLKAHTSGGSIKLHDSRGDLTVHTSGGSISIDQVGGSVDASTSGGSITANLLAVDKYLKLRTSGGSVKAVVPTGLGMNLDLKGNKVNTRLQNFDGEVEKDRVKGSINGGGIDVVMATSGGSVNLEYR